MKKCSWKRNRSVANKMRQPEVEEERHNETIDCTTVKRVVFWCWVSMFVSFVGLPRAI